MNTLFLVLIILCAFNQAIGIGGGSWFEGKRSPKKRSTQCRIRWHGQSNCGFKRLRRFLSDLSNEQLEDLERFLLPENTSVSDRQLENFDFSDDVPEKKELKNFEHILLSTNISFFPIKNLTKKRSWKILKTK